MKSKSLGADEGDRMPLAVCSVAPPCRSGHISAEYYLDDSCWPPCHSRVLDINKRLLRHPVINIRMVSVPNIICLSTIPLTKRSINSNHKSGADLNPRRVKGGGGPVWLPAPNDLFSTFLRARDLSILTDRSPSNASGRLFITMQTSISSLRVNIKGKESNWLWMGPRGVTAIYFTQRANAAAHAPTPRTDPPPTPARIMILPGAREAVLWAQGYNLNCKKIKQFLISSIATTLLLVLAFIFISVTSQAHSLPLFLFFNTLHSLGLMTSNFMNFALLNLQHILLSSHVLYARRRSVTAEIYLEVELFFTASESKKKKKKLNLASKATGITCGL